MPDFPLNRPWRLKCSNVEIYEDENDIREFQGNCGGDFWFEGYLSGSRIAVSRIPNPHEYAILRRARCSAPLPCSGCEAKDLLRCSSGQPVIQAVLDSLTVQRSRSFGFAETVSKHFALRVALLRMVRRGLRWIVNRNVYSGHSNAGNALSSQGLRAAKNK